MSELLNAALTFATAGMPVLPLHHPVEQDDGTFRCSCGHERCASPAKHPRTLQGVKDATTNGQQIREWWASWPDANIGIACGHGHIVVDIDGPDAETRLDELQREHGSLPATMTVHTGRDGGGRHLYFHAVSGAAPHDLGRGLEVRGAGRYVVAAHSRHITGRYYTPIGETVYEAPKWLLEHTANGNGNGHAPPVGDKIRGGERNNTLASLAGTMRRRGMDVAEIEAALQVTNRQRCEPPLEDREVHQIAVSISRYKPADYTPKIDEKTGKLKLSEIPVERGKQLNWLTDTLARDPERPIVACEWQGVRGPEGHVVLKRAGARPIRFEPAAHIMTPLRLSEALAFQREPTDEEPPAFTGAHCRKIAHVIGTLCDSSFALEEQEETEGIVGAFLQASEPVEGFTTHGTTSQRYEAAEALQRPRDESTGFPLGAPRYLIDSATGELIIRVSDLRETARKYVGGSLRRGWLDGRIANLGWSRAQLDGHLLAGRDGRQGGPHLRCEVYRGHLGAMVSSGHDEPVTT